MLIGITSQPVYVIGGRISAQEYHQWLTQENIDARIISVEDVRDLPQDSQCILGFMNIDYRREFLRHVRSDLKWPVWIHPTAFVSDPYSLGKGTLVDPMCSVGVAASIGEFNKLGPLTKIGHNDNLGTNVVVTAGTLIGGSTVIGDHVYMGHGCIIRDKLTICDHVFLNMGSRVTRDITDPGVYYNNQPQTNKQL